MNRDWQYLYSTAIDHPEKLQSLPQHLNSSSLNHVFTYIAQEVAERLQSSQDFPVNRDSNPDETIMMQAIAPEYRQIISDRGTDAYGECVSHLSPRDLPT